MSADEQDPYLAPPPPTPLAGLAPDLAAVLRARRDRALARREAERAMRRLMRERPDLYFRSPLRP